MLPSVITWNAETLNFNLAQFMNLIQVKYVYIKFNAYFNSELFMFLHNYIRLYTCINHF